MRPRVLLGIALALVGAAALAGSARLGVAAEVSSRRPIKAPARELAVFGDSLGVGLSPHLRRLAELEGAQVRTWARVGATARATLSTVRASRPRPMGDNAIALVSLSTNDGAGQLAAQEWPQRTRELTRELEALGWSVLYVLPSWGPGRRLPPPSADWVSLGAIELERDGIHPTPRGYRDAARVVGGALWWGVN